MNRVARYSSSRRVGPHSADPPDGGALTAAEPGASVGSPAEPGLRPGSALRWRRFLTRYERALLVGAGGLAGLAAALMLNWMSPSAPPLTQRDIDQAVLYTLENMPRAPSLESQAYEVIRPSVVLVRRLGAAPDSAELLHGEPVLEPEPTHGIGTGVVIVDDGTILTNLHVVLGAERLGVVFADGTESEADLVSVQPEQDLAVIQARLLPDDLIPATLTSTRGLRVGDRVAAVGFPFSIGPSLSSGVVSGLRREYHSPEGERILSNLIQFDAAANPGNSGGPLINADGHVVGIVTAIVNPTAQRVFIGIGFAVPIETAARGAGMSPF
jgi:S1-C subfamily serine protease